MRHKVKFLAEFKEFEFRVFFLRDRLVYQGVEPSYKNMKSKIPISIADLFIL